MVQERELNCDVLVAGGGMAGVACALAAARCGAKVILCQDRPVLGGNASSEVRMHICGADCSGGRGMPLETEAREGGIVEEVRLEACVRNPQRSPSMFDLILYDKCRAEPNLSLMLNTIICSAEVTSELVRRVVAERPSTEDRFMISAKVFVDCTGDGRLGVEAGAPYRRGREARHDYNEPSAPEQPDNKTLGSTLLFQARNIGRPVPFVPPSWARKFTEDDLRFRAHGEPGGEGLEYGYWWMEWGGQLDTIKDNERIRDELLAILLSIWDHIKNRGDHGAENWALEWFGFLPGKRESRRFVGQCVLSERDLVESRLFEDAVAYGGWPIDLHPPEGIDASDEKPAAQRQLPYLYDIPLRACVSSQIKNLMFAGRNLSATHVAFGSTRVMATCAAVGQGVGTAAAYAAHNDCLPADLASTPELLRRIQQRLLRDDAFLLGRINLDPDDLAREASVSASSAQPGGPASAILSGITRATHGLGGAPPNRAVPSAHRWMSDPAAGFSAWLKLQWERPILPREVQLVFDTGLHRPLTLTHSDAYAQRMVWGVPQPETVRDYTVEAEYDDGWRTLVDIRGNHQRRRVHALGLPGPSRALRIVIRATNGLDHARVCEVRVY